jgi:hypothetical protein
VSYAHAVYLAMLKTRGKQKAVRSTTINSYIRNLKGFRFLSPLLPSTLPKLFKPSVLAFAYFSFPALFILFISFASFTFFFPCKFTFPVLAFRYFSHNSFYTGNYCATLYRI